ncbi:hypothetical protein [Eubacterium sp.]
MKKKDMEQVEKVMDGFHVGYAYLYPNNGGERQEYVFDMTPENIANFIGSHPFDAEKIILTDMQDKLILNTIGNFIDYCPDQDLCKRILPNLIVIQMREVEASEFPIVTREIFDEYCDMEEETVMRAEISML